MAALNYKEFYVGEISLYPIGFGCNRGIEWYLLPFSPVSASWLRREEHHWVQRQREGKERAKAICRAKAETSETSKRSWTVLLDASAPGNEEEAEERPAKALKCSPSKSS